MDLSRCLVKYTDLDIAKAIIDRNSFVTKEFLYRKCYPLFKSIYDNYYTDCNSCKEFIDEIYLLIISPSKKTGKCQIEQFRGDSTLTNWVKAVCLFYCYNKFNLRKRMPVYEHLPKNTDMLESKNDRFEEQIGSIDMDLSNLNKTDAIRIIEQMSNKRYQRLIILRYLEQRTNEETAEILGMSMENYYNKHKLAKAQYIQALRKEDVNNVR
jgi:RNA polymerase sigma factor (sigma-70 family)